MPFRHFGRNRFMLFAVAVVGWFAVTSSSYSQVGEPTAIVRGFVKAADGGAAVPGATVRLQRKELGQTVAERVTQTGPLGGYEFLNLPQGHYVMKTAAQGFIYDVKEFDLVQGQNKVLDVMLVRHTFGVIEGQVKRAEDGVPVPGANVALVLPSSNTVSAVRMTTTNLQGGFRFGEVPAGAYTVEVSKNGFATQSKPVEVTANTAVAMMFEMERLIVAKGSIRGQVKAITGETIAGAKVYYSPSNGMMAGDETQIGVAQYVTTNLEGIYEIPQLEVGAWQLSVVAEGYYGSHAVVEVLADTQATKNFTLERRQIVQRGVLAGRVTDAVTGAPIPGVRIYYGGMSDNSNVPQWWEDPTNLNVPFVTTNLEGRYRIEGLAVGAYHLLALSPDYEPQHMPVEVLAATTVQAPFALTPKAVEDPGSIQGTVKTVDGQAITGAKVFYQRLPDPVEAVNLDPRHPQAPAVMTGGVVSTRPFVETNAEGAYEIANLRPGSYHLLIEVAGYLTARRIVVVEPNGTTTADFVLQPRIAGTGAVSGRVIDALTRQPVAGVYVVVMPAGDVTISDVAPAVIYGEATTNANGEYFINGVPAGYVAVAASKEGYRNGRRQALVQWDPLESTCRHASLSIL